MDVGNAWDWCWAGETGCVKVVAVTPELKGGFSKQSLSLETRWVCNSQGGSFQVNQCSEM